MKISFIRKVAERLEQMLQINKMRLRNNRTILYTFILITGAFLRFAYYSPTLLDSDSTGYLSPALNLLINGEFNHVYGRSYPYPLFLALTLYINPDINFLSIAQHILSLFSIFIFMCAIEIKVMPQIKALHSNYWYLLPFVFLSLMTFDGNLIQYEKMLRPEAIMLSTYMLLISTLIYTINSENRRNSLLFFTLSLFPLIISSLLHPRFVIAFAIVSFILLAYYISKQESTSKKLVVMFMFFTVTLTCYIPEVLLTNKFDKTGKVFPLKQFFYSNIPSVNQLLESGEYVIRKFDNTILKKDIREILSDSSSKYNYPILTYNIDRIQYDLCGKELSGFLHTHSAMTVLNDKYPGYFDGSYHLSREDSISIGEQSVLIAIKRYNEYYIKWVRLIIQKRPAEILRKTFRQIYYSLFVIENNFLANPLSITENQSFERERQEQFLYLTKTLNYVPDKKITVCRSTLTDKLYGAIFKVLHYLFLTMLICSIVMLLSKKLSIMSLLSIVILAFYLATVAITHTLDVVRYTHSLQPIIYIFMFFLTIDILKVLGAKSVKH